VHARVHCNRSECVVAACGGVWRRDRNALAARITGASSVLAAGCATTSRVGCCLPSLRSLPGKAGESGGLPSLHRQPKELHMPIILWLLGVPLTVIVLLMLFHVL
jgi:hypothetical protein